MTKYADILLSDLESVRGAIRQQEAVKTNLAGDRCIIKWGGDAHQCIDDLNCTCRTHAEALAYYNDPINGWCEEPEELI